MSYNLDVGTFKCTSFDGMMELCLANWMSGSQAHSKKLPSPELRPCHTAHQWQPTVMADNVNCHIGDRQCRHPHHTARHFGRHNNVKVMADKDGPCGAWPIRDHLVWPLAACYISSMVPKPDCELLYLSLKTEECWPGSGYSEMLSVGFTWSHSFVLCHLHLLTFRHLQCRYGVW